MTTEPRFTTPAECIAWLRATDLYESDGTKVDAEAIAQLLERSELRVANMVDSCKRWDAVAEHVQSRADDYGEAAIGEHKAVVALRLLNDRISVKRELSKVDAALEWLCRRGGTHDLGHYPDAIAITSLSEARDLRNIVPHDGSGADARRALLVAFQNLCDHKMVDSPACTKCGWEPGNGGDNG